ncbi:MAG: GNAT family protein [Dehalococcoidia bacterium]
MPGLWQGMLVFLRAIEPGDVDAIARLDADDEAQRLGDDLRFPRSAADTRAWTESQHTVASDGDNVRLAIVSFSEMKLVGLINVHGADRRHRSFEYGITIGGIDQGKGYGREAVHLLLRYMFEELGYHAAHATVYAFNQRSQRFHEAMGFTAGGRLRESHFSGGRFHDELIYTITAREFADLYGGTY